jgi:acetylornithine deacetylase
LIDGEPTESTLAIGTKGALRLLFRAHGVAAHSAYPHLGRSAIHLLLDVLDDVRALEFPSDAVLGNTTLNVGVVAGGVADNVVAAEAHARVMIRLVSDADTVLARVREAVRDRVEVHEVVRVPPMKLATIDGFPTSVVAYATDVPALSAWGTPYLFGPGSINVAHRDDEHIEIDELYSAVDAYERLAITALHRVANDGTPVARR